jgi:hypothetical protein
LPINWWNDLGPVTPKRLKAIINWWIMAGSNHHSSSGLVIANAKRQHRGRSEATKYIGLNLVCCKNTCNFTGKLFGKISRIIRNNCRIFLIRKMCLNNIGHGLSCTSNVITIDSILSHTHRGTQPSCAELKISIKTFRKLGLIFGCVGEQRCYLTSVSFAKVGVISPESGICDNFLIHDEYLNFFSL